MTYKEIGRRLEKYAAVADKTGTYDDSGSEMLMFEAAAQMSAVSKYPADFIVHSYPDLPRVASELRKKHKLPALPGSLSDGLPEGEEREGHCISCDNCGFRCGEEE